MVVGAVFKVMAKLSLLVFMLWISIAISRVVCCATFSMSAHGIRDYSAFAGAFSSCFAAVGEQPFLLWNAAASTGANSEL